MKIKLIINPEDKAYVPHIKQALQGYDVQGSIPAPNSIVTKYQITEGCDAVITTRTDVLSKLITRDSKPVISNYAGSIFKEPACEVLIINPLAHINTVPYGRFLVERYISKITKPSQWYSAPPFSYSMITHSSYPAALAAIAAAPLVAIDIETTQQGGIYCIGFGTPNHSYVLPVTCMEEVVMMRALCATPSRKVTQNGKYDLNYLLAYSAPVTNWLLDTATIMHSWYSELPKDLASINAFLLRDSQYWKDMSAGDLTDKYHYNALDCYVTVHAALSALQEMSPWAKRNYLMEFPINFPCLHCEMTGIKRDMSRLDTVNEEATTKAAALQQSLETMTIAGFNSNSPPQCKKLLTVLGCKDIAASSSDEKSMQKAMLRHPINSRVLGIILKLRKVRKLISTYITAGKEFKGRILYSLNPHGTDTGRLASKESSFWCGLQIQNIPRGKETKSTLVADEGWMLAEVDLEQAESRYTGYISGDPALIKAVETSPDCHSQNASAFFGVPFSSIYSIAEDKVLDKPLRDLAKRVNHGANYNMGKEVLLDTMGETKVWEAKRLLGLPKAYGLLDVTAHLLKAFHKTYPHIAGTYYNRVILDTTTLHKLVGATGWTRYCFGDPRKSKLILNSYVAHCPQSLSAMNLNKAFLAVWLEVALLNPTTFRLLAQIHDSILFTFRVGHHHLAVKVKEIMERETRTTITACTGKQYTFFVPAAIKAGKEGLGAKYWSETE